MEKQRYIEAGQIVNTHGVKGEVKIQPWVDSADFLKTFKILYIDRKPVTVLSSKVHKNCLIAAIEGVEDVNAAMAMKGRRVFIDREDANLPQGSYFLCDIIGANVQDETGAEIGKLVDIMETPASMIYVVRGEKEHLIPAVPEFIKTVDTESGVITVKLIEGM